MRSRYTAYTQANTEYIAQTMKPPASDQFDVEEAREWARSLKWLKLDVLNTSQESNKGYVEFIAYFSQNKREQQFHEKSEFHLIDGRWYYINGEIKSPIIKQNASKKMGRNDLCAPDLSVSPPNFSINNN